MIRYMLRQKIAATSTFDQKLEAVMRNPVKPTKPTVTNAEPVFQPTKEN